MEGAIRKIEAVQKPYEILDAKGKKICSITYDPLTGDIFHIQTEPYENIEQEAEHAEEYVYVTHENGTPTGERISRQEARDQQRRYLLVSVLLEHGGDVCVPRRSPQKKIDPGKESISAHGVAKLLYRPDGTPITDLRYAALVNAALELNEELRHGRNTKPFNVIVWPGSEMELYMYAHSHPMDDPNTVYLVGGMVFADHGYPLYQWETPRTRFVINGHVFSKEKPSISIDLNEVDESRWLSMRDFALQPRLSEDSLRCAEENYLALLKSRTPLGFHHSHRWVANAMSEMFDKNPVYEGRSD